MVRKFSLIVQYYIESKWDDVKAQLKRSFFYIRDQKTEFKFSVDLLFSPKHKSCFNRLHIELAFSLPGEKIHRISFDFPGAISLVDFDIHVVEDCNLQTSFKGP